MSNLTISIDDDLLRSARVKAVVEGTSVNEICRQAIAAYTQRGEDEAAARARGRAQAFVHHAQSVRLGPGDGPRLDRDQLYEEMLSERSPGSLAPVASER